MPRGYDVYDQANIERRIIPPTDAIVGYNNLSLFIAGSGSQPTASILDISPKPKLLTLGGGITISNSQTDPFGTQNGVLSFNGTNATITAAADTGYTLGSTGNFTISLWVRFNSTAGTFAPIITNWLNITSGFSGYWFLGLNGGQVRWYDSAGNSAIADTSPATGVWINYAIVRSGSTITMYKNGISIGTQTTNQAYTNVGAVNMGFVTGGAYLNAFVYDVRVIKGTAVYTANFTPPSQTQTMVQIGSAAWQLNEANQQLWTPIQLSPSAWYDAADSGTITLSGSNVTQWNDKSGNGRNMTVGGNSPTIATASLNGLNTIAFDNRTVTQTLIGTYNYSGTNITLAAVAFSTRGSGTTANPRIWSLNSTGNLDYQNTQGMLMGYAGSNFALLYRNNATAAQSTVSTNALWSFHVGTKSGGNATISSNGESRATGTTSTAAFGFNEFRIGGATTGDGGLFGNIAEALMLPYAVTISEQQQIEGYLAWKWGLVANLPSTHPYKNSPPYIGYQSIFNQVVGIFSRFINRPPIIGDGVAPTLWSPIQLSPAAWWDASDSTTITLNGSTVSQMNDKSGNARNLVQATAALQPTFTTNGLNGLSTLTFASTGNVMTTSANFPLTGNATFSVFYVYRKTTATNGTLFGWGTTSAALGAFGFYDDNTFAGFAYAGANTYFVSVPSNNVWNLMSYTKAAGAINTTSTSFLNGTDNTVAGSSTSTPNILSNLFALGRWADFSAAFIGNIAEMIITSTTATTAERQQVEGYLAWKWGLVANLPSTHPYKNSPPFANP